MPKEYWDTGNYHKRERKALTYTGEGGYLELEECWYERLPEMWQALGDQYVVVNYDKALYCEIDCRRDAPLNRKYCPLLYALMGESKIPHN